MPGASVSRAPLPRRLDPGTVVRVLQASGTVITTFTDPLIVENNYVANRYDNERSGCNPNETTLTVDRARGLAKICEHMVDGPIRAQPLFVQDVDIPGKCCMPTMLTTWTITSSVSPASTQSISWVTLRRGSISAVGPNPGATQLRSVQGRCWLPLAVSLSGKAAVVAAAAGRRQNKQRCIARS
jgi:hypothetical protein